MRILEELHYHSKTNPRYIQELRSVLTEQGIIAERSVIRSISVKDDFRKTNFWLTGNLYVNQREKVPSQDILTLRDAKISFDESATANMFTLPTRAIRETEMFTGRSTTLATQAPEVRQVLLKSLGKHVIRTALWDFNNGNFRSLKNVFGSLESLTSFITDQELLGGVKVSVSGTAAQLENLSQEEKRQIARFVVEKVLAQANREEFQFRGSMSFKPMPVKEVFGGLKELKLEEGSERTRPVSEYELYLESWFAQNEIWGTSEEKQFLNFLRNSIVELDSHFKDIVLFRNEKHFPLYAFESGDAFFPDFVLFMKSRRGNNQLGYQIFIEPKGDQFLDEDREFGRSGEGWKQKFLMQISDESKLVIDGENHRLIGLPFFNAGRTNPKLRSKFNEAFKSLFSL
jgi:type III restriction enzyme